MFSSSHLLVFFCYSSEKEKVFAKIKEKIRRESGRGNERSIEKRWSCVKKGTKLTTGRNLSKKRIIGKGLEVGCRRK